LRNRVRSSDATRQTGEELVGSVIFIIYISRIAQDGFTTKIVDTVKVLDRDVRKKVDASRCNILYLSRYDKIMRRREREGERKRELMDGPDDSLSRADASVGCEG